MFPKEPKLVVSVRFRGANRGEPEECRKGKEKRVEARTVQTQQRKVAIPTCKGWKSP